MSVRGVSLFVNFLRGQSVSQGRASGVSKIIVQIFAIAVLLLASPCALPAWADSVTVSYTATDLGAGAWEYDYSLTGSLSSGDDLAIYFPLATSTNLNDLLTGGTDFATFVFQPDPGLPADGEYDIVTNLDNPSLAPSFDVSFVYEGSGSPGSQSFILYDPNFNILESGDTTPAGEVVSAIPEPASLILLGSALIAMYTVYSWRSVRYRDNEKF